MVPKFNRTTYTSLGKYSQNLEKQFRQFGSAQNSRPQGELPGNTDPNPKQVNVVGTLTRSGLQLEELALKKRNVESPSKESEPKESEGIPRYAKYVKEIMANKRRLAEYETIALTKECSSRIQNKFSTKLKDSGSFTLGLGSPKPTTIILQLADRSIARLEGVVEDVLVQVGSLILLVNFMVLNFEPDPELPFILGRPFLTTGCAIIDVVYGQLTMRAHDKVEVFDVYKTLKLPSMYEELSVITVIDLEAEA
ncbi:uncharacterized protein LOC125845707 [Solanum stenotomum]|uniref:uncharacterized protein LOC125845707 n=1 Tax=Solanum stenotomum TaxID=172797 RepID=UPI0020D0B414|nr:uncharacterized protein LOC125845707 [Solanum stenotomum]